jgi:DnaJ-class molecular chaperone
MTTRAGTVAPCEGCNGTGKALNYFADSDWFEQDCSHCGGSGNAEDQEP